jgi:CHASE1-domain containing sensor protein
MENAGPRFAELAPALISLGFLVLTLVAAGYVVSLLRRTARATERIADQLAARTPTAGE